MIGTGLAVIAVLVLVEWFGFREQGRRYEQIIRILEADRDAARNEAKVFRNLLFPVMTRAEGAAVELKPSPQAGPPSSRSAAPPKPATPTQPKTVDEIFAMRIPYRDKFKLLLKLNNSKQQRRDTLASALGKQKPASTQTQETQHGTV
jgi:hypothetical protein